MSVIGGHGGRLERERDNCSGELGYSRAFIRPLFHIKHLRCEIPVLGPPWILIFRVVFHFHVHPMYLYVDLCTIVQVNCKIYATTLTCIWCHGMVHA